MRSRKRHRSDGSDDTQGTTDAGAYLKGEVVEKHVGDGDESKLLSRREALKHGVVGIAGIAAGSKLKAPELQGTGSPYNWYTRAKGKSAGQLVRHLPNSPPAACTPSCTFTPLDPCTALCQTPGAGCTAACVMGVVADTTANPCTPGCVTDSTNSVCTDGYC